MDPSPQTLAFLVAAALVAGMVDAIAGGGGLVTLPALLAAGLPPHAALGTNKGQSIFGTLAAIVRFRRAGMIDLARARLTFPLGFAGSLAGAGLVLLVSPAVLRPLVLVLLIGAAAFVAVRRTAPSAAIPRASPRARVAIAAVAAFFLGGYDGFFGPGTGTFLIVAFVALLGDALRDASAAAKVVNFASNLAALLVFAANGVILWRVAVPMAAANAVGGWLGAHLTVRGGDKVVRRVVLVVVAALVIKIGRDIVVG
jgi:uncharacterized membrane protein YfcA